MKENCRRLGTFYEKKAGAFLVAKGYQILTYNYRCPCGEIDIIAKDGDALVFCEVKYRNEDRFGHPLEAVDYRKQRRISRSALYYLMQLGNTDLPCRFDVIGIEQGHLTLVKNAFMYLGE